MQKGISFPPPHFLFPFCKTTQNPPLFPSPSLLPTQPTFISPPHLHFPLATSLLKVWLSCAVLARTRCIVGNVQVSPSPHYFLFPSSWQLPFLTFHCLLFPSYPPTNLHFILGYIYHIYRNFRYFTLPFSTLWDSKKLASSFPFDFHSNPLKLF